jgi:GH15 family glucan-1,4-alpha-glucosidase
MSLRIEDYALIGDTATAALVGRDGSIDWLCMPRFDSPACFAALLGGPENGRWLLAPTGGVNAVRRRYRDDTLLLETEFQTEDGVVALIDFMPLCDRRSCTEVVRVVEGRSGTVPMSMEVEFRFDYGRTVPWVRRRDYGLSAIAGPNALNLRTPVRLRGKGFSTVAEFHVRTGETVPFTLTWYPSHEEAPGPRHPLHHLRDTEQWWREWSSHCTFQGPWRDIVMRSLITLKALTYSTTGGIVAAPTTSLPEEIGGVRNWDYRYCWLRDATFTLYSLAICGYTDEARAWREWLLRAVAGRPQELQIMYGVAGERFLAELELAWLPGYEGSRPTRIGNAAHEQFQLDVFGEVMDALHVARKYGVQPNHDAWRVETALVDYIATAWTEPDEGIWEVRGPRQHFTHSKVMAWVAVDRAVKAVERFGFEGAVDKWRALRAQICHDVLQHGFNPQRNAFVQHYGSNALDASLLMIPLVGFLPASDPRVVGTVEAIRRELMEDGLVRRYRTESNVDGLPGGDGAFLACTFWLADNLAMMGRTDEARQIFDRLLALCNDVGLLAEEYCPRTQRMLGNFPQAFSHVCLINSAENLTMLRGPAAHRATE